MTIDTNQHTVEERYSKGLIAVQTKNFGDALNCFTDVLKLDPCHLESLHNRAYINFIQARYEAAIQDYDAILSFDDRQADIWCNRGSCLFTLRKYANALDSYARALQLAPKHIDSNNYYGITLIHLNRYHDAIICFDRLLLFKADHTDAFCNRGIAFLQLNKHNDAIQSFNSALSIDSSHGQAHWNKSLALLAMGDYLQGWQEHEWRWETAVFKGRRRQFDKPEWSGKQRITGKTILLYSEQGLGDTIQFCRFAKMVEAMGAHVILDVQQSLRSLLSTLNAGTVHCADAVPDFDFHCSLIDLPGALRVTLDSIPKTYAYLSSDVVLRDLWKNKLGRPVRPKIGVCWSGNPEHANDKFRSVPFDQLSKIFSIDADFVCLQKELRESEHFDLKSIQNVSFYGSEIDDFSDTAAIIWNLDLVITVDTSIAHLAGALGKETWLLLPFCADWRWLIDRHDSPWYLSATLFRQSKIGDWSDVIATVFSRLIYSNFTIKSNSTSDIQT